jgi:outer membrane protein OmpA-like peptidoglycan-associated protein
MKKTALLAIILVLATATASGQSILNRLKDRAKDAVERNIGDKIEKGVDDLLSGKKKDKDKRNAAQEDQDTEEAAAVEQQDGQKKGKTAKGEEMKSDFVPGTVVIFEDDLTGEKMGEFPSKWDLIENNAEVARMNGKMAIKFEHGSSTSITPLIKDGNKKYLPEVYTLEFDFFAGNNACYNLYLRTEDNYVSSRIWVGLNNMSWSIAKPGEGEVEGNKDIDDIMDLNDWNHFALSFNKRALKAYVNGKRIINVPNARAMDWFTVDTEFWEDHVDYITNIRLAKGAVDLYERNEQSMTAIEKAIAETGKFVTNNILFETGKAVLKPESMEEIQKVADYMKKNPQARFEVQGHTDNQGSDKVNDPLSQQRAEAVVKALEDLGVDPFNLRSVGKGSHEPVADNKTDEGRARNRRVEFIKK